MTIKKITSFHLDLSLFSLDPLILSFIFSVSLSSSLLLSCLSASIFSCLLSPLPSSLVLSLLFHLLLSCLSFSVLCLSPLSLSRVVCCGVLLCVVCVVVCWWCVVVCVCFVCVFVCVCVCCGTLKKCGKKRVWIQKRLRVYIQNVAVPAPRVHVFQHVRVVPVHTVTF